MPTFAVQVADNTHDELPPRTLYLASDADPGTPRRDDLRAQARRVLGSEDVSLLGYQDVTAPTQTPEAATVTLPAHVWMHVDTALRSQRYELQRFLAVKTEASEHVREATRQSVAEINTALDAISRAFDSLG